MKTKLSTTNLLDELLKEQYADLRNDLATVSYPAGKLIYWPGHGKDQVFIVKEGAVRIYLAMEDKEFSLAILEPGDVYTTHTRAHVAAASDVTLLVIPTPKFHQYMVACPALSFTITSILGELMKQSFSIIDSLVFKDITSRIADFLLFEAERSGTRGRDGLELRLELTMEQIAAIVGSSRQTVSTIINTMLRAEVLQRHGRGTYLIPNPHLLKDFSTL